jgi:hypothetical protein
MTADPFVRKFQADCDELVAARWWNEALRHDPLFRTLYANEDTRRALIAAGAVGALALLGIFLTREKDDDGPVVTMDALAAQRRSGWNIGAPRASLYYDGIANADEMGRTDWRANLDSLTSAVAPTQPGLAPYFVPTLFQVLSATDFAQSVVPIHTDWMDGAQNEARALASLFRGLPNAYETALLIDAPGPEAVAAALGVADVFEPVFLFDNWPHPHGVVPSHEVIGAIIYHRRSFELAAQGRAPGAPAAFVIDSRRLSTYRDASDAFDNRYLAKLPGAEGFGRLGVKHLLYVSDHPVEHEPDDLNADFVALAAAGIDVKMVALSDFRPTSPGGTVYSYGGSPTPHVWFWHSYGWYSPPRAVPARLAEPTPPFEAGLSRGAGYRPVERPTMFSSRVVGGLSGVGKQKPSGFGRVSFRTSSSTGEVSLGRSGSFGRTRSSWFSGG